MSSTQAVFTCFTGLMCKSSKSVFSELAVNSLDELQSTNTSEDLLSVTIS